MNIALILCPAWSREEPHLALGLLSSVLRKEGHRVFNFDFNNRFYLDCDDNYKNYWLKSHDLSWCNPSFISDFITKNDRLIRAAVSEIIAAQPRIVGFSTYFPTELMSLVLAERIKSVAKDIIIVFGGSQCLRQTKAYELIKQSSVDIVAIGEGEDILRELVSQIERQGYVDACPGLLFKKNGTIIDGGNRPPIMNLDMLPFPDFDDFQLADYEYHNALPVLFSRGCIQRCVFCTVVHSWQAYRTTSGKRMYEQLQYLSNRFLELEDVHFYDPLINGNISELNMFCELIIEAVRNHSLRPLRWRAEAIIRPEMTAQLLLKMKNAGCYHLAFGIESGSQRVLDSMHKHFRVEDAEAIIHDADRAGMKISLNFMFGFPTETREDFEDSLNFLRRNSRYIYEIYPSESFCYIDKDSYIYHHPEEFGLLENQHGSFWETKDGKNTYPERIRRFEEFCDLAVSLGINAGSGYEKVKLNKDNDLKRYFDYKASSV